ncbi:alpha/beta hydrolase [Salinibacterium hongtaonis]|uniref:Esterase n=1 Tax=Homoserinimonas hongtaonis TaxID=2079791 RepID=A0A2U1SXG4_9MICO|nr:alpha/beta fold hydrolase [Salinibacterium hongtaonis]AWB88884.1 esterase [Salinibacterium hongtaonis]PWB96282.1 esterase [Salinibacterium hongtaonis]
MTATPVLEVDDSVVAWSHPAGERRGRPLVVLLHGRGSHEQDLMQLAPFLLPDAVYAAPRAPLPFPGGGYTWFPTAAPGLPDAAGVAAATRGLLEWLDRAEPSGPVAVVGFSQGGALATHLMRFDPERCAAYVCLSGFVVPGNVPNDATLPALRPPLFWGRDTADPVIPLAATDFTGRWLPQHSTLTVRQYPGAGHGIVMEEIEDVRDFLAPLVGTSTP